MGRETIELAMDFDEKYECRDRQKTHKKADAWVLAEGLLAVVLLK